MNKEDIKDIIGGCLIGVLLTVATFLGLATTGCTTVNVNTGLGGITRESTSNIPLSTSVTGQGQAGVESQATQETNEMGGE